MRFEQRTAGESADFWVFDVDPQIEAALEPLGWEHRDGGWRKSFRCPVPEQAARAFANIQYLLEPTLRQYLRLAAVPWQVRVPPLTLQRAVSARRGMTGRVALIDQSR